MNEPEFVAFLQQTFPFKYGMGIGDDTSVVKVNPEDSFQLITTDILIEGVHFKLDYFTMEELALKSLAVNLSDIAAMGGLPQYFYLGLGFPPSLSAEKTIQFFKGLESGCARWDVALAGGDYSSSPLLMISITVIGRAQHPVYRHNAQVGDLVGITGKTGESALGLKLLLLGEDNPYWAKKHKEVEPELAAGPVLSRYANAMIDVSDGLLMDLNRILAASAKGARIHCEKLPVSPELHALCHQKGWDEHPFLLSGGEDYVLLFTIPPHREADLKKEGIPYTIIGEITGSLGQLIVEDRGKPIQLPHLGYDHFGRGGTSNPKH